MKNELIVVIVLFFIVIAAAIFVRNSDESDIKKWGSSQDFIIDSIEETMFDYGPFWYKGDDDRIYRVKVKVLSGETKTAYFRFGFIGYDWEWYK